MLEFFSQHQMFIVLFIVMIIWGGIIFYLFRLDKKIKNLENKIEKG